MDKFRKSLAKVQRQYCKHSMADHQVQGNILLLIVMCLWLMVVSIFKAVKLHSLLQIPFDRVLPWFCKIEHGSGGAPPFYGGLSLSGHAHRAGGALASMQLVLLCFVLFLLTYVLVKGQIICCDSVLADKSTFVPTKKFLTFKSIHPQIRHSVFIRFCLLNTICD